MPDEDPNAQGTQSGTEGDGGASGSDQGGSTGTGSTETGGASTGTTTEETVSKAEHEQALARMRAADQRASQREAELKAIRDKDLPEAEKTKKDLEETTKRAEAAEASLRTQRIQNAFLRDNTHSWKDPEAALALVDLTGVDIAEDGQVTGLKDALKRLSGKYPWMLNEKGKEGDEGKGGSGAPPMNGKPGSDKPDKSKLAQRLPALRTRVRPQ